MARKTTCEHMCTCCITWWPCCPAFCWIERSRHSWVAGYVTGWALSVLCGVSSGAVGALSELRRTLSVLLLQVVLYPTSPQPCLPPCRGIVTPWPRCRMLFMPVCLSWSRSSPLLRVFVEVKMVCRSFSATLCNAHRTAVAPVYITCDYSVSFCWFYQCWLESVRGIW